MMRTILSALSVAALIAGLVVLVLFLRDQWEEQGKDRGALVGAILAGVIIVGFAVFALGVPSWIGRTYYHTEDLQTACIQVHNFTDLPETELCKELYEERSDVVNDYRRPVMPECYENEIIVGTGTFTRVNLAGGYWSDYECRPATRDTPSF